MPVQTKNWTNNQQKSLQRFVVISLIGMILCSQRQVFPVQSAPALPTDRVVIDGKKNPENIPEWIKWSAFFNHMLFLDAKGADLSSELHRGFPFVPFLTNHDLSSIIFHAQGAQTERTQLASEFTQLLDSKKLTMNRALELDDQRESLILNRRDNLAKELGPDVFRQVGDYLDKWIAPSIVVNTIKK